MNMSKNELQYCAKLLSDSFGGIAKDIGLYLLKKGSSPLKLVASDTKLPLDTVQKTLSVLIKQNVIEFRPGKKCAVEYWTDAQLILARKRFPYFVYSAKTLYGDIAEMLIEELLFHGQMTLSELLIKVKKRLAKSQPDNYPSFCEIRDKFELLAKTHFVHRCPRVDFDKKDPELTSFVIPVATSYDVPVINFNDLEKKSKEKDDEQEEEGPPTKKIKLNKEDKAPSDKSIVWQVSVERFDQYLRDQEIVGAVTRRIDGTCAEVVRTMLRLAEVRDHSLATSGSPVTSHEIFKALPKKLILHRSAFDQYMKILIESMPEFIDRVDDSGGGTYSINFKKAFKALTIAHIESIVCERFGSKSLRIFRILLAKQHLEPGKIEKLAMLPPKECKDLLYHMVFQGYVSMTEVTKTMDYTVKQTIFLYRVNLDQVTRIIIQHSYQALSNLVSRRQHETANYKRVLEKQQRVEMVIAALEQQGASGEEQRAEAENMLTSGERKQLAAVQHMTKKLEQGELQMAPMLFVLETHMKYCTLTH